LIEQGADVNIVDVRSRTPLRALLDSESFGHEHIKCLLEKGTDVNVQHAADGKTALMVFLEIIVNPGRTKFISNDSTTINNVLNDFVKHGTNLGIKDKNNMTALNLIVRSNLRVGQDILKKFVEDGEGVDWSQDKIATPVCWALSSGAELNVLEYFGKTKADFKQKNQEKKSPLHMLLALEGINKNYGKVDYGRFKFIVDQGADVNEKSPSGLTPLFLALQCPVVDFEIVKYLVEKGADVRAKNDQQCGVLHLLIRNSLAHRGLTRVNEERKIRDIIKYLVDNGADVNLQDKTNAHRPIHLAAISGSYELVKYFAEQKAELNVKSLHGSTPLHFALIRDVNIDLINF
jgi:ankyrin repeat protein